VVRHRIASYSQQSQRYVAVQERFPAVMPPTIAENPQLSARFEAFLNDCHALYGELMAAGIPAEDARFVLPNAAETKLVMTMNARELRHFFALRCCRRAQWEIREMATAMLRACKPVAPLLFAGAGPGCLVGACPEGKMTCGQAAMVRQEFKNV
jgi:thymidylate synthase (FAD)